jgi:hypothetical protein
MSYKSNKRKEKELATCKLTGCDRPVYTGMGEKNEKKRNREKRDKREKGRRKEAKGVRR